MAFAKDQNPLRVLVVEDSPSDLLMLRTMLMDASRETNPLVPDLRLYQATSLAQTLSYLETAPFDILLLDLNLPDSQGLETFRRLKESSHEAAVVVLTGLADNTLAVEAIRHGAQDYLIKDHLDSNLLVRSLCYAVERQRLQAELERVRQMQYQRQEMLSLEELSKASPEQQESVQELLRDYTVLVQRHVRATRLQESRPAEHVRAMAQRLTRLHARARDVVQLHLRMLENTGSWAKAAEERAFANDARLVLLELMGNLIDIYQEGVVSRVHHE
ncbi:MAG: response regulator [Gammaproteobacteria bacterium]|nr:response regulator [Gammaproteobacteria bacterium]MCP5459588.1 response regulator [Gammaproteobacteria bacterium]